MSECNFSIRTPIQEMHVRERLKDLAGDHNTGHDIEHYIAVANHALKALKHEELTAEQNLQVEIASLLHDVDDHKFYPDNLNYENARMVLNSEGFSQEFIDQVVKLIDLVSCSKNSDSEPPENWMVIPRDCDRLEAIGQVGIDRCLKYNNYVKRPFHTENTTRVYTEEELWKVATQERFQNYKGNSESMIDHYYDKLLHIGKPDKLKSRNPYILEEAAKRQKIMVDYVLEYWKQKLVVIYEF